MKNLKPEIQIYTVRRVIYLLPQTTCRILHTSSYKMRIFIGSELSTPFFFLHDSYGDQIQQMGKTNGSNLKQLMCQNVQFLEWPLGLYRRPCCKELVYSSNIKLLLHGWPRTANFHLLVVYSWDCPLKIKLLQAPPGRFWPSGLTFDTCAFRCHPPFFVCLIVNHVS